VPVLQLSLSSKPVFLSLFGVSARTGNNFSWQIRSEPSSAVMGVRDISNQSTVCVAQSSLSLYRMSTSGIVKTFLKAIGTGLQRRCNSAVYPLTFFLLNCVHTTVYCRCRPYGVLSAQYLNKNRHAGCLGPSQQPGSRSKLRLQVGRPAIIFCGYRLQFSASGPTESVPVLSAIPVVVRATLCATRIGPWTWQDCTFWWHAAICSYIFAFLSSVT
jgi:hypothetical protein